MYQVPLLSRLRPKRVPIDNIYLDPNNPRLFDVDPERNLVPENRITDDSVQERLLNEMCRSKKLDVRSLRDSILHIGFLPMDRVVVRKILGEENKYVVVEGNRRIAAIKWILKDHLSGELTLDEDFLKQLKEIEVLELITSKETLKLDQFILQGNRHISGVKNWGPYQQSEVAVLLRETDRTSREIGQILGGLSTIKVNRLIRANLALRQMKEDEEYGMYATPDMFSYFEETIKNPYLRQWLGWDDSAGKFMKRENLLLFYSWITPSEDLSGEKKIPMAIDVRDLPDILQDEDAKNMFMKPNIKIEQALAIIQTKRRAILWIDWRSELRRALEILSRGMSMGDFKPEDIDLLQDIVKVASQRINEIKRLIGIG